MTHEFTCHVCKKHKTHTDPMTTGYGTDRDGHKICFVCCGMNDKAEMILDGKAVLYLTEKDGSAELTNWPGTFRIPVKSGGIRKGCHNIAHTRTDVWFTFNGKTWHGVQYGEFSQLCRCKRLKCS